MRKTHVLCTGLVVLILAFAVACGSDNTPTTPSPSPAPCASARSGARTGACAGPGASTRARAAACPRGAVDVHDFTVESAVTAGGDRHGDAHDRGAERRHHDRPVHVGSGLCPSRVEHGHGAVGLDLRDVPHRDHDGRRIEGHTDHRALPERRDQSDPPRDHSAARRTVHNHGRRARREQVHAERQQR